MFYVARLIFFWFFAGFVFGVIISGFRLASEAKLCDNGSDEIGAIAAYPLDGSLGVRFRYAASMLARIQEEQYDSMPDDEFIRILGEIELIFGVGWDEISPSEIDQISNRLPLWLRRSFIDEMSRLFES